MADASVYRAMAEGYQPTSPLGYRILIPLIARYSPLPNTIDFLLITICCTAVIVYNLIKIIEPLFEGRQWKEWEKALLFLWLQTGFCFSSFYDNPETDTAAFAAWVLAYRFLDKSLFASTVLCIGVVARETTLFIVPLLMLKAKQFFKPLFISLPALLAFFAIRIIIPSDNFFQYYLSTFFLNNFIDPHWLSQVITVFGIAPVALIIEPARLHCFRIFKYEFWILFFWAFLSCCVAAAIDRFVFMLFPFVLVPACASVVQMSSMWKMGLLGTYGLLMIAKLFFIKYWMINEWYEVGVYTFILLLPIVAKLLILKLKKKAL